MPNGVIITHIKIFVLLKLCNNLLRTVKEETHVFYIRRQYILVAINTFEAY